MPSLNPELIALLILVLSNIVTVVWFSSNISSRVKSLENSVKVLFDIYKVHETELKTLNEIKGQLSVLTSYILPRK